MSRIDDFMSKHGMDAAIVFSEKQSMFIRQQNFLESLKKLLMSKSID